MTLSRGCPVSVLGSFSGDYIIKTEYASEPMINPFHTINLDNSFRFTTSEEDVGKNKLLINRDAAQELTNEVTVDSKRTKKIVNTLSLTAIGRCATLANTDNVLVSYKLYYFQPSTGDLVQKVYIDKMTIEMFEKVSDEDILTIEEGEDSDTVLTGDKFWYIKQAFSGRYMQGSKSY
mgnify:CR=1 FL=1